MNFLKSSKDVTQINKILALVFSVLALIFIVIMATNKAFFDWAFTRHQNVLSWYLRPLSLIPFCYFAYKRNPMGIAATIFLLLTSMAWFPVPSSVDDKVIGFLQVEKDYLTSTWTVGKILISSLVPITMGFLAAALWKRKLKWGIFVLITIAFAKMFWSVLTAGSDGTAIMVPAMIGLVICIAVVYYGFKRAEKKKVA
ncbi:MAG: hypothetical protein BGO41_12140 [Clostridiales bacterium 38-18]|nr:MAG: hypothetical protein BGO41_12140 [Clostridiales bacterium 38-18]